MKREPSKPTAATSNDAPPTWVVGALFAALGGATGNVIIGAIIGAAAAGILGTVCNMIDGNKR